MSTTNILMKHVKTITSRFQTEKKRPSGKPLLSMCLLLCFLVFSQSVWPQSQREMTYPSWLDNFVKEREPDIWRGPRLAILGSLNSLQRLNGNAQNFNDVIFGDYLVPSTYPAKLDTLHFLLWEDSAPQSDIFSAWFKLRIYNVKKVGQLPGEVSLVAEYTTCLTRSNDSPRQDTQFRFTDEWLWKLPPIQSGVFLVTLQYVGGDRRRFDPDTGVFQIPTFDPNDPRTGPLFLPTTVTGILSKDGGVTWTSGERGYFVIGEVQTGNNVKSGPVRND